MNRRTFLKMPPAALSIAGLFSSTLETSAAADQDVVQFLVDKRPWTQRETFVRYRHLSAAFTELRIAYNGPNGYENSSDFKSGVWDIWRRAFGKYSESGYTTTMDSIIPVLNERSSMIETQMRGFLDENKVTLQGWLKDLGIAPEGIFARDIIRAQGSFAIAAATQISKGDLSAFSDNSWVYPFC